MGRFCFAIILLGLCVGCSQQRGIEATVVNTDTEPLPNVSFVVTGNRHDLGTIQPGESASVQLRPVGASSLTIEVDESTQMDVDAYFEPGYHGTISVSLQSHGVENVDKNLRLGERQMP